MASILTICQACGVPVRIPKSVVRAGRAAQCPKCGAVLTGPAVGRLPDKKPRGQPPAPPAPPAAVGGPEPVPMPAPVDIAEDSLPAAEPRRGINCAGLALATGTVLLIVVVVVGGVLLRGRPGPPTAARGKPAAPATGSRQEQLLHRLDEIQTQRQSLEQKRADLERGQEDENLDAVLTINKELRRLDDEEKRLRAELQGKPAEIEEPGP